MPAHGAAGGDQRREELRLDPVRVLLEADGQIVDTATGAALGQPAHALANTGGAGRVFAADGLTPRVVRRDGRAGRGSEASLRR